jgi:hypothetical protein
MEFSKMKVGQHVEVLPEATGYGLAYQGTISKIETMRIHGMLQPFVTIDFDDINTPDGRRGITITNMRLVEPAPTFNKKWQEINDLVMKARLGKDFH